MNLHFEHFNLVATGFILVVSVAALFFIATAASILMGARTGKFKDPEDTKRRMLND